MGTQSKTSKVIRWTLIGVLLVVLIVKTFFIANYRIPQNGMYPTLPANSRLFVNKRAYPAPSSVKRGDIVIFVREEDGQKYHYIWRVIGLPGEKVEASGAALKINGRAVERQRIRQEEGRIIFREQVNGAAYEIALDEAPAHDFKDVSVTVPPEHFFVMGDNRFNARDSRDFGPIPFASILGKKL